MDWIVSNALSRDVERQHLNKILKEIRADVDAAGSSTTSTNTIQTVNNRYAVANFMLTLAGDVTGSAQINGLGDVTLTTALAAGSGGVQEAPLDNQYYWRWNGVWEAAPTALIAFAATDGEGILVKQLDPDFNSSYVVREIETASSSRVTVVDGDGIAGNPTLDLALVANGGGGSLARVNRDAYGRIAGTSTPSTTDLAEGSNLYYTDERVDDRVSALLVAGDNITITYDDVLGTLEIATSTNTAPTIASGFGTSPSISASNGTSAFTLTIGTATTGVTAGTITMPAATTGWVCSCQNITNPDFFIVSQTGGTTTTITLKNYSRTTGLAADFTDSTVIRIMAQAY